MKSALPRTIPALAAAAAWKFENGAALVENGRTWSFTEILREARAAASAFLKRGIGRGHVVAIWAPNSREWILAALGAQMAGAAINPLNTRLKGREAGDILRRSRARILFTVRSFLGIDFLDLLTKEALPQLEEHVFLDYSLESGWDRFLSSGNGPDDSRVDTALADLRPDDVSDILFTSGTTGAPKGVVSTHEQVVPLFRSWAEAVDLREGDRYLIVNPFFHTFGYKAGWVSCLLAGAIIVPMPVFNVADTVRVIEKERITFIPGPPTIYQELLAEVAVKPRDFSSLRVAVTGAAAVPPILVERMRNELGFKTVITGYGMTECGAITMCRTGDAIDIIANTSGRVLAGLELKIIDDDRSEVPPDRPGEILVRGFGVMQGYLDDPVATAEAIDAEGWLHTGDIGVLDAGGNLRITDRKKDMYISGGFNCYPAEIEKLLCEHPSVEMAAVIGIADERLGEVGKAFLVLRPGHETSAEEIISWSRLNMANYKVPRKIEFRSALPKNAAGKILRIDLRDSGGTI